MSQSSTSTATGWVARLSVGLALWLVPGVLSASENQAPPRTRSFQFTYGVTINELAAGATARIWLPVAQTNYDQTVEFVEAKTPTRPTFTTEKQFGNRVLYLEARANEQGEIPLDVVYRVTRSELKQERAEPVGHGPLDKFLQGNQFIPVDGRILQQLKGQADLPSDELPRVRQLYDLVDGMMKYDKPTGQPWGRGDAVWACDSKYGNCTDFHSVFIGACRDLKIPAQFEMGFPLPEKTGAGNVDGYHCWAKFAHQGHWIPVDISEADKHPELKEYFFGNLTADRVQFSVGRDLELEPAPANGPVNFLVYPYVEVGGKVHTKFAKRFRYEDL